MSLDTCSVHLWNVAPALTCSENVAGGKVRRSNFLKSGLCTQSAVVRVKERLTSRMDCIRGCSGKQMVAYIAAIQYVSLSTSVSLLPPFQLCLLQIVTHSTLSVLSGKARTTAAVQMRFTPCQMDCFVCS